ncbi:MAG: YceI family protein [Alphaproteobacteria bacterium]|nr:YceI family protein [Alphaproteobacteria bacterium]
MLRRLAYTVALMTAFAMPAHAEPQKYSFDKVHTQIQFMVNHLGFSNSTGKFLKFDGGFVFDEANPAATTAELTIDTNSINMDDATWEEHLKDKDWFNVATYPSMSFKSTKVEATGDKTAKMTGDLTLLGQTKPVTLDVTLNNCGAHPMSSKPTCGFSLRGTLKRADWGMTNGIPMVSDDVQLHIEVEASAEKEMNK